MNWADVGLIMGLLMFFVRIIHAAYETVWRKGYMAGFKAAKEQQTKEQSHD